MNFAPDARPFPIPVVTAFGPGAQVEDESLDYISMPQGMAMYRPPVLPEPEEISGREGALRVFHAVLEALKRVADGATPKRASERILLTGLQTQDLALINQVLGEGEVSAQVMADEGVARLQIQESVFAGVWRVLGADQDALLQDYIEVGSVPEVLRQTALADGCVGVAASPAVPPQIMNVPSILVELEDQRRSWRAGDLAHVVNLTLLPLSPDDIGYLDDRLGTGRVLILSRGYGNCRITNCCVSQTWRVVYYNSMDTVILNSVEVTDMPEVACAAPEDLRDSIERLHEVMQWVNES